jgi:hypothetical protein
MGPSKSYEMPVSDPDFVQATALWNLFATQPGEQEGFFKNVAGDMKFRNS